MRNQPLVLIGIALCLTIGVSDALMASADTGRPITTNKDKLLTLAVQGKIAPAEPSSTVRWMPPGRRPRPSSSPLPGAGTERSRPWK